MSVAFNGQTIDSTGSTASYISTMQSNVAFGRDAIYYLHSPAEANMAGHWQPIIDAIKALVDADEAVSLTVPQAMTAAFARGWV